LFCLFASLVDRSLRLLANTLIFATLAAACGRRSAAIVSNPSPTRRTPWVLRKKINSNRVAHFGAL
jgi:hypothetical protein